MLRIFLFFLYFILIMPSSLAFSKQSSSFYQVDVIVFAHTEQSTPTTEHELFPIVTPEYPKAIPLQPYQGENVPFSLLPASLSQLKKEYWALSHKGRYQVLGRYSWLQPVSNRQPVIFPTINRDGWNVKGMLRVRQRNYYLVDTELLFSTNKQSDPFLFSQKQRLKDNVVYYFDHPQAGMLIKIHKVA